MRSMWLISKSRKDMLKTLAQGQPSLFNLFNHSDLSHQWDKSEW